MIATICPTHTEIEALIDETVDTTKAETKYQFELSITIKENFDGCTVLPITPRPN